MERTAAVAKRTLFDKLWAAHVIKDLGDDWSLLHIDRNLLHDLSGPYAFAQVRERSESVAQPRLGFAVADHAISSAVGRRVDGGFYQDLKEGALKYGVHWLDINSGEQGIVHVVAPELGIVLPGLTLACGDSHTCTNGAMGALAIGVGSTEGAHALITQTLRLKRPLSMRIRIVGKRPARGAAKDIALHIIRTLGTATGAGHAIEFAGPVVEAMSIEERLTLCNLAVEMGARFGVIAPDQTTFEYLKGRRFSPAGEMWDQAVAYWKTLRSHADAHFNRDVVVDISHVAPTVTWGTSPEQAISIDDVMPRIELEPDPARAEAMRAAYDYMGLVPGAPIAGTPIQWVFIGSCNNARLSDLEAAAAIVKGKTVAKGVNAWVVPGSETVKRLAENAHLDQVFRDAGFEWREPSCAMCAAVNGEVVLPLERCVSTSNRNFVGRQGPKARTHLASPAMAAAAAIAGAIVDVRSFA
jgi:3-isopropylmalate/(R)-2-methylmalate dehydratase large subunit